MTKEEIIRNLKYTMEKHKNDTVYTFGTNISVMCKDILDYFEEQEPCDKCVYSTKDGYCQYDDIAETIPTEQESCDDIVSREAILSKIKEVCFSKEWTQFRIDNGSNGQRDFIIDYIEQLPFIPQKSGKWIYKNLKGQYCSVCDEQSVWKFNYCPNCGARMRGAE